MKIFQFLVMFCFHCILLLYLLSGGWHFVIALSYLASSSIVNNINAKYINSKQNSTKCMSEVTKCMPEVTKCTLECTSVR